MQTEPNIRRGHTALHIARDAVREFYKQVQQDKMELVLFFCSPQYDLDEIAAEMNQQFHGVRVVGCTTAGEIGPLGLTERSLAGISFRQGSFHVQSLCLHQLQSFDPKGGYCATRELLHALEARAPGCEGWKSFAILLIDGLSKREEIFARILQSALGSIPLVGGSASDAELYQHTSIFYDGAFASDLAALIVISTKLDFELFKAQHYVASNERLVVTEADPKQRLVTEINGLPAAREYARLVGMEIDDLAPDCFAAWPMVVMIDGTSYVRSIQKVNPDQSMTLFCALEAGVVLRVARGVDLPESLKQTFEKVRENIGPVQAILIFSCILRKHEMMQRGLLPTMERIYRSGNAIGFFTFGEQFRGMHINQTLVGVAIAEEKIYG